MYVLKKASFLIEGGKEVCKNVSNVMKEKSSLFTFISREPNSKMVYGEIGLESSFLLGTAEGTKLPS